MLSHGTCQRFLISHFYVMNAPFKLVSYTQLLGAKGRGIIESDDLPLSRYVNMSSHSA